MGSMTFCGSEPYAFSMSSQSTTRSPSLSCTGIFCSNLILLGSRLSARMCQSICCSSCILLASIPMHSFPSTFTSDIVLKWSILFAASLFRIYIPCIWNFSFLPSYFYDTPQDNCKAWAAFVKFVLGPVWVRY